MSADLLSNSEVPPPAEPAFPAMPLVTLAELSDASAVAIETWRHLADGTVLRAPRLHGESIVLNLTPDEDCWLSVKPGFNYRELLKLHDSCDTECMKVYFNVPPAAIETLDSLDKTVQRCSMTYADSRAFNWLPLIRSDTAIVGNIVLGKSDAPTHLHFILSNGSIVSGSGVDFLFENLGKCEMNDFQYKALVEPQFVHVREAQNLMSLAIKVHSLVFVATPKEDVIPHTDQELDSFVRAAKRLKVNQL